MSILDIPVVVLSGLGDCLHIICPSDLSQEEADVDSIA